MRNTKYEANYSEFQVILMGFLGVFSIQLVKINIVLSSHELKA